MLTVAAFSSKHSSEIAEKSVRARMPGGVNAESVLDVRPEDGAPATLHNLIFCAEMIVALEVSAPDIPICFGNVLGTIYALLKHGFVRRWADHRKVDATHRLKNLARFLSTVRTHASSTTYCAL